VSVPQQNIPADECPYGCGLAAGHRAVEHVVPFPQACGAGVGTGVTMLSAADLAWLGGWALALTTMKRITQSAAAGGRGRSL
jgi:hypothetical protein